MQVRQTIGRIVDSWWAMPLLIMVVGTTAALISLRVPAQPANGATTVAHVTRIEDCTSKGFPCYDGYLRDRTLAAGPAAAIADVRRVYATDAYAKSECHQLTHAIGHAAYDMYKDAKTAFTKGDSFCWSGYYHGVVEEAVEALGIDKITQDANNLCSAFSGEKRYSFDHFNCVHGLGHGFMSIRNYELFKSLKDCDTLTDQWERSSCYGGVFMENVMIESRGDTSKSAYLKPDQPMYPCTAVDYAYKEQCYLMQTSYALRQNGYDFAQVFKECHDLKDTDFIDTCYQSTGRDASGSTVSDVARTKANCDKALDTQGLENCMLGAVRDFISYYHSDEQGKQLCAAFTKPISDRCYQEVTTYYATFR